MNIIILPPEEFLICGSFVETLQQYSVVVHGVTTATLKHAHAYSHTLVGNYGAVAIGEQVVFVVALVVGRGATSAPTLNRPAASTSTSQGSCPKRS